MGQGPMEEAGEAMDDATEGGMTADPAAPPPTTP
jgi:hypothetical protein